MAHNELPFLESLAGWSTLAHGRRIYQTITGGFSSGTGPNGQNEMQGALTKTLLGSGYSDLYIGLRMRWSGASAFEIISAGSRFPDSSDYRLAILTDGRITSDADANNANSATQAFTTFTAVANGVYYVEMRVQTSMSTDDMTVLIDAWVNNQHLGQHTHAVNNTSNPIANGLIQRIVLGTQTGNSDFFSDYYISQTGPFGDGRVIALFPNGDGSSSDWLSSPTGANFEKVDEHDPDDLTTYNYTSTVGAIDEYELEDMPSGVAAIKAVEAHWCISKSDAGVCELVGSLVNASASVDDDDTAYPSEITWFYKRNGYTLSPFTASAFTTSEVNGLKLKIERTA